ncbi:hypothetical protein TELCIR_01676 [Teladorsagia circumcincta]|uniref:Uncharacterized protein n=1 Tax=Teladorsagia circumcincta TaxID=45464 RepID=A0A2G9V3F8_TELCI|nr:hypothetical protein TELCIR_01676 [Teladorsagia circumcincta]
MDSDDREEIQRCSKKAYTVPEHARCVVKVLDATRHVKLNVKHKPRKETKKNHTKVTKSDIERAHLHMKRFSDKPISHLKRKPIKLNKEWVGGFRLARAKRDIKIVNRSSYNLASPDGDTLFSKVVRQTAKTIRKFKNKNGGTQSWRSALQRITRIGTEAREMAKRRKALKKRLRAMIDNTPDKFQDPRKPLAMNQMEMEDEELALKKKLGKEKNEEIRVPMRLLRESIKIALVAAGKNVTNFDKKTLKIFSPRFLSVVPEQDTDDLVSECMIQLISYIVSYRATLNTFTLYS